MAAGYFSGGTTYSYDIHDQGGASTADHHIINLHTLYLMNPAAATAYVGFPMDQATTSPANMQQVPVPLLNQQSTAAGTNTILPTNNQQQFIGLIPMPDQTVQARRLPAAASHDVNSAGFLNSNILLRQLQYNLMWRNNNAVTISDSTFAQSTDDQQSGNHHDHDHDQLQLIMSPTNTGRNLPAAATANSVLGIGSLGTNDQQQQAGTLSLSLSSSAPDRLERQLAAASNVLQLLPVINIVSAADQAAAGRGSDQDQMKITRPMKWDSVNNTLQMGYPCKYVKAAQQLLDEVVNVRNIGKKAVATAYNKEGSSKLKRELSSTSSISGHDQVGSTGGGGGDTNLQALGACGKKLQGTISSSDHELMSVAEKQELQVKKTKLVTMLDEVEQRYRQYHHEMQLVVSSFEAAAGVGAANTYTALALHTISKQFRCLREAISAQVRSTSLSLGEDDAAAADGSSRHLRYVDNQLRQQQQRALQQLGMIQQNAWRPQRGLPERAVSVLRAWLFEHFLHPYPKDADKHLLAKQTGLTRSQVSNWFINARVRLWKPMVEEMYTEELKQQHDQHNNELIINNNNNNSDDHQDVQIKDKNTTANATSNHLLKMNDQSTNSSTKSSATTTTTTPSADDHDQISTSPPVTTHAQQTKIKKTNTKLRRQDQKKDSTPMNSSNDQNMIMKKTNTMEAAAVIPTSSTTGDPADQNIVLPTIGFNMINAASSSDHNGHVPIAHLQLDHMAFLNHINSDSKKMIFKNMNGHRDSMMISTTMSSSSTNIDHEVAPHHDDQLINSNQEAARNIKQYAMNINDDQYYHSSYRSSSDVTTYAFTTAAAGIDNNISGGFGAYHQLLANNINVTSCRFSAAHGANNTNGSVSLTLGLPDHDCSDSVLSACSLPAADHNDHSHDPAHQPNFITNQNMSIGIRNSSTTAVHQHHHDHDHDHSNDYCVLSNSMPETATTPAAAADHIIINPFENLNNMQSSRKRYAAAQSATFA